MFKRQSIRQKTENLTAMFGGPAISGRVSSAAIFCSDARQASQRTPMLNLRALEGVHNRKT
jgi:hypothetical protein